MTTTALHSTIIIRTRIRSFRSLLLLIWLPFLVDSVCATIAGFGLTIERLIHPVVAVRRDAKGQLVEIAEQATSGEKRESVIYIELERTDARIRRKLISALRANLKDVAAAVSDWLKLQIVLGENADALSEGEGATLLRWFLDRNFTLLGHEIVNDSGDRTQKLGLARMRQEPILSEESRRRAFEWYEHGGKAPLIIKSNQLSTVHRHVLMDLIIIPVRDKGKIVALSIIYGMWTSAALAAAPGHRHWLLFAPRCRAHRRFHRHGAGAAKL